MMYLYDSTPSFLVKATILFGILAAINGKSGRRSPAALVCQKTYFDRLAEVTKADKTSNSPPKCMWILERGELRSKSKSLAQQAF